MKKKKKIHDYALPVYGFVLIVQAIVSRYRGIRGEAHPRQGES